MDARTPTRPLYIEPLIYTRSCHLCIGKLQRNLELELKFKPSMLMGGGGGTGAGGGGGGEGDDLRRNQTMPHSGRARKAAPGGGATLCREETAAPRESQPGRLLPVALRPPCHAAVHQAGTRVRASSGGLHAPFGGYNVASAVGRRHAPACGLPPGTAAIDSDTLLVYAYTL